MLRTLLDHGADVHVVDGHYASALHRAAANGLEENVRILCSVGCNVSHVDGQGRTALHLAAGWGRNEIIRLLVREGAKVSHATMLGDTALHAAAAWGRLAAAEALSKRPRRKLPSRWKRSARKPPTTSIAAPR